METGLKNRVAIVAASSQGIGKATAEAFAAEGCRVAMCARNGETLKAAADRIRSQHGVDVYAEPIDVSDADAVRRFVSDVAAEFGSVDICVTNAGGPAEGVGEVALGRFRQKREGSFRKLGGRRSPEAVGRAPGSSGNHRVASFGQSVVYHRTDHSGGRWDLQRTVAGNKRNNPWSVLSSLLLSSKLARNL